MGLAEGDGGPTQRMLPAPTHNPEKLKMPLRNHAAKSLFHVIKSFRGGGMIHIMQGGLF